MRSIQLFFALLTLGCFSLAAATPQAVQLSQGDTIAILGNRLAEGLQHTGYFDARVQTRVPELELRVRNLGFSGDEVDAHQRTMNFGKFSDDPLDLNLPEEPYLIWDRYLEHESADVILACFGGCEAFDGLEGLEAFRTSLTRFCAHVTSTRYDEGEGVELWLVAPLPIEDLEGRELPKAAERNPVIARYRDVMREVALARRVRFIDLFDSFQSASSTSKTPLTIDGMHLNDAGYAWFAEELETALFGTSAADPSPDVVSAVRAKNELWFRRYQAVDGYNLYGHRSRLTYDEKGFGSKVTNFDVLQREMDRLDRVVEVREAELRAKILGQPAPDLADTIPPLLPVRTNKPGEKADGSFEFLSGDAAIAKMTPADGLEVNLFADEAQFPEFVNPVQMAWDGRGRLWVLSWASYPSTTAERDPFDRMLILEDTDGDGRADSCKTFAGDLHNPTGFEFWDGGVIVATAPDLFFLEDTDGDDRYDRKTRLLTGLSSGDTHHAANSFVVGPDGALYFQEGTFHMSQVETVHGVLRNRNGCVWRYELRTGRLERYVPYNFANPHGHVFDRWGQDFVTDGTGNVNYYALPFTGHLPEPLKKPGYFPFFQQRSRPCGGTEILSSEHFPESMQGNYMMANVIGFRGIFHYRVDDAGSGFGAEELQPIVESSDPNFRPVDLEVGPDGALYFLDWHNPIIGHMQHHIRDPNRDRLHGRVYRVTAKGRPLVREPAFVGQSVDELLKSLESPTDRVRYRARLELSRHRAEDVLPRILPWIASIDRTTPGRIHHILEAAWLHQQFNRFEPTYVNYLLADDDARARAAAVRIVRQMRHRNPAALATLMDAAADDHPRVRLEAVVGASFFGDDPRAVDVALIAAERETDRFLDYALADTLRALENSWRPALVDGSLGDLQPRHRVLLDRLNDADLAEVPRGPVVLGALIERPGISLTERRKVARALARQTQRPNGRGTLSVEELLLARLGEPSAEELAPSVVEQMAKLMLAESQLPPVAYRWLATDGVSSVVRAAGMAGLARSGEGRTIARELAGKDGESTLALLRSLPLLDDPRAREALADLVEALAREVPSHLAGEAPGLVARFYEPATKNARRETFSDLVPVATGRQDKPRIDTALVGDSDSFSLVFEGLIDIEVAGEYTFATSSDDGSRLYVGDVCVVDNDGLHGTVTAKGKVTLEAGKHPFLVTYFENGGGESLRVRWSGPKFAERGLQAGVLSSDGGKVLRAEAIRALAHLPGREASKAESALKWMRDPALAESSLALLAALAESDNANEFADRVREHLVTDLEALPVADRTSESALAKSTVARSLGRFLREEQRAALQSQLDLLAGTKLALGALPHRMLYDVDEFYVEADTAVAIDFTNGDSMPHNVVFVRPGASSSVGEAAEAMAKAPDAEARAYIPVHDAILAHTGLVKPGETERLSFQAPSEPGSYPYLCTYPGHWRVMQGVMHVVERLDEGQREVERTDAGDVVARAFVREWTLADIEPLFEGDWRKGTSIDEGRRLFGEAGCLTCHCESKGYFAGPDLTQLRDGLEGLLLARHLVEPSFEIAEGYQYEGFEYDDGTREIGRVLAEDDEEATLVEVNGTEAKFVFKPDVVDRWKVDLSPMPTGMLVTLNETEILNLVRYLEVEGQPAEEPDWLSFPGGSGPGEGLHVVLLAGDEEYRSEESMPMLGKLLSERFGFQTSVLFSLDPETKVIDPDESTHIPGMHLLDDADLVICQWRFRRLGDLDMSYFVRYVEAGKPIIGLRTATHAFNYPGDSTSPYKHYGFNSSEWPGGFGKQILGETWVAHHGHHGVESTRGVHAASGAGHPILQGVGEPWGPTDVYTVKPLPQDATALLEGAVLTGMKPTDGPVDGAKNSPMMPVAWSRELSVDGGVQRVVCTTMGSSIDCADEHLRRFLVNASLWCVEREDRIDPTALVDTVGPYAPTPFGFGKYTRGVTLDDLR